jgi:hypothetical protein
MTPFSLELISKPLILKSPRLIYERTKSEKRDISRSSFPGSFPKILVFGKAFLRIQAFPFFYQAGPA